MHQALRGAPRGVASSAKESLGLRSHVLKQVRDYFNHHHMGVNRYDCLSAGEC